MLIKAGLVKKCIKRTPGSNLLSPHTQAFLVTMFNRDDDPYTVEP